MHINTSGGIYCILTIDNVNIGRVFLDKLQYTSDINLHPDLTLLLILTLLRLPQPWLLLHSVDLCFAYKDFTIIIEEILLEAFMCIYAEVGD